MRPCRAAVLRLSGAVLRSPFSLRIFPKAPALQTPAERSPCWKTPAPGKHRLSMVICSLKPTLDKITWLEYHGFTPSVRVFDYLRRTAFYSSSWLAHASYTHEVSMSVWRNTPAFFKIISICTVGVINAASYHFLVEEEKKKWQFSQNERYFYSRGLSALNTLLLQSRSKNICWVNKAVWKISEDGTEFFSQKTGKLIFQICIIHPSEMIFFSFRWINLHITHAASFLLIFHI